MARLAVISMFGVLLTIWAGRAHAASAASTDEELVALAEEAGIEDVALLVGAMASQPGVDPRGYLIFDGLIQPPVPPLSWQVECIISKESGHRDVYNRQGSGATGPGQYMPSTWRRSVLEMGMPWLNIHSLNDVRRVAAHDLSMGRRRQWTVSGC